MANNHAVLLTIAKKIKALSDTGLLYSKNEYDKERYAELRESSFTLMHELTGQDIDIIKNIFSPVADYPTAKVDIRGLLLNADNKILLAKESADHKWSLPGGWADVGFTPKEIIIKEFKEETGLDIIPERLLAVFDKKMHPHPPQPFYVYKLVFYCKAISTTITKGFDVLDVQFFAINQLPELSEDRILKSQVELLYHKAVMNDTTVYVD